MLNVNKLRLRDGDKVAIAATARKVTPDEIACAVRTLESWGLSVLVPEGLFLSENQFAGSDNHRAALLQNLLDDPDIRAIFCARGGYGTVRILDRLDLALFVDHPKWIVGYSDVTALHSHMARHTGIPTIHGIMPINFTSQAGTPACHVAGEDANMPCQPALASLHRCLFDGSWQLQTVASEQTAPLFRQGECHGITVGGNLSVLYSLLGSESDADTDGKILLLEDLDEYLYHIDRMMMALKRAGKLRNLAGLAVGQFTEMHDNSVPFGRSAQQIIFDAVAEYDYPVAIGFNFGHIGTNNEALLLNSNASLHVSDNVAVLAGTE